MISIFQIKLPSWFKYCVAYVPQRNLCKNSFGYNLNRVTCHTIRGRSRTAATSKMECLVIIVNDWKPLTIIAKRSMLDVAAALDLPLTIIIFFSGDICKIYSISHCTKLHFSIRDFFSKCEQTYR